MYGPFGFWSFQRCLKIGDPENLTVYHGLSSFSVLTMAAFSVGTRWAAGFCGSPWLQHVGQHVATLGDLIFLIDCMVVLWVINGLRRGNGME